MSQGQRVPDRRWAGEPCFTPGPRITQMMGSHWLVSLTTVRDGGGREKDDAEREGVF